MNECTKHFCLEKLVRLKIYKNIKQKNKTKQTNKKQKQKTKQNKTKNQIKTKQEN